MGTVPGKCTVNRRKVNLVIRADISSWRLKSKETLIPVSGRNVNVVFFLHDSKTCNIRQRITGYFGIKTFSGSVGLRHKIIEDLNPALTVQTNPQIFYHSEKG